MYVNQICNPFAHGSVYQFADDTCLITDKQIKIAEKKLRVKIDKMCK